MIARAVDEEQNALAREPVLATGQGSRSGAALVLVLKLLTWCGEDSALPRRLGLALPALSAAMELMRKYFLRMAARVYGGSKSILAYHYPAALARWIFAVSPPELHIRHVEA